MEKIYLDKEGYENYLKEIEKIKKKIEKNNNDISIYVSDDAYGDGWHDNFAYEQAMAKEISLFYELKKKMENLKNIEIIESKNDGTRVDVGCIVEVEIDEERELYKLTADVNSSFIDEIPSITLNSPLGKAIYHKNIGDLFEYFVDDILISGSICRIDYV